MQKITIIANDDLYKVLGQAGAALNGCGVYLAASLNDEIAENSAVVIADAAEIAGFKGKSKGGKFITLVNAGEAANYPDAVVVRMPYHVSEIIELIQTIVAQSLSAGETVEIGGFEFDVMARLLTKGQKKITLTEKEADLVLLLHNAGGEVAREEILRDVWGYEADIDTHTIETHIYRIRQKLGKKDDFIGSSAAGYFIK